MSVGSREREGRPCPGWTPGSARHRPKNRLKGLRLCAEDTRSCSQSEVHNSRLHRHKFLLLSNEGDQTAWFCLQIFQRAPSCPSEPSCGSDPTAVPRAAASWGCQARSLQRPGSAASPCPERICPSPGRLRTRRLSCPPSADQPARYENLLAGGSLGSSSNSSRLDAVPEINHTSLKSHSGPLFLLENTPGSSLESRGDRPRLLCSALHKIAISRLTSRMSQLVASDRGK